MHGIIVNASPKLRRRNLKTQHSPALFCACGNLGRGDHVIIGGHRRLDKASFSLINAKPAFTSSFGLKSVSEKFRLREGLV